MNVFVVILMFLLAAGFYFIGSPGTRIMESELDYAITTADMRAIAECAASAQTAAVAGFEFDDICVEQYAIDTRFICMNDRSALTACEIVRGKKPAFSFVITATGIIPDDSYNRMLEILEADYPNSGAFGIYMDGMILAGGGTGARPIPKAIATAMELSDGQLTYMTQFALPDVQTEFLGEADETLICPPGTIQTYRFGRWQCVPENQKVTCTGDYVWDADFGECVPDETRRPLCDSRQTAVIVDDVWECIDPFTNRECPTGYVARLNYTNLEWECVTDPSNIKPATKCENLRGRATLSGGRVGGRISNCTDCEKMITDPDTCETSCIPDPDKIGTDGCYPTARTSSMTVSESECGGSSRAFYFGFPNASYDNG